MPTKPGPKKHPPQLQAQAVALLMVGRSWAETAKACGVPVRTVRSWYMRLPDSLRAEIEQAKASAPDLGALFMDYLKSNLETITIQVRFARDLEWLKAQSAGEFATLHGVLFDKGVRGLEAIARAVERQHAGGTPEQGQLGDVSALPDGPGGVLPDGAEPELQP